MKLIIDRIENSHAVCEDDNMNLLTLPLDELPRGVREGDHLRIEDSRWIVDTASADEARARVRDKMDRLFSKKTDR